MVYVTGMNERVRKVLSGLDADHCLPEDGIYEHRVDALRAAMTVISAKAAVHERTRGDSSTPATAE